MIAKLSAALAAGLAVAVASGANAVTLDFEVGCANGNVCNLPAGYGGLTWTPTVIETAGQQIGWGNTPNFPSGHQAATNGSGFPQQATSDTDFILNSALFRGFEVGNKVASFTSTSVTVQGILDGVVVAVWSTPLTAGTWTLLSFGGTQVDKFVITPSGGVRDPSFLMDNLIINESASVVPIPAALPLFATILAGGGLIAWRRKRKAARAAAA